MAEKLECETPLHVAPSDLYGLMDENVQRLIVIFGKKTNDQSTELIREYCAS